MIILIKEGSHKDLLRRELRIKELKPFIDEMYPIMKDVVDQGTHVLRESFERWDGKRHNIAIPLLHHNQLEMLDALSELCLQAISRPARLLVRSMYESFLYILYINKSDHSFENKAAAYTYEYHRQMINLGKKVADSPNELKMIEDYLKSRDKEGWKDIIAEHRRTKEKFKVKYDGRPYSWFSLFDGPINLDDLVKTNKKSYKGLSGVFDFHNILYHMYSLTMHSNDSYERIQSEQKGSSAISFRVFSKQIEFLNAYRLSVRMCVATTAILLTRNCSNAEKRIQSQLVDDIETRLSGLSKFVAKDL